MNKEEAIKALFGDLDLGSKVNILNVPFSKEEDYPISGVIDAIHIHGWVDFGVQLTDAKGKSSHYYNASLSDLTLQ